MKVKGLILDFGFTLFYFKNVSVDKYFECFRKGLDKSINFLKELNVLKDDIVTKEFIKNFKEKRAFYFQESVKTKNEFTTKFIFQNILESMEKEKRLENLTHVNESTYNDLANLYHSFELEEWVPFEQTRSTLEKISSLKDLKIAVLSNHPHHPIIEEVLKKHDLLKYFNVVVTSAKFGKRKPHPDIFNYTLEKLGLENNPNSCLMCGDEHADIVGGHKAGLQTILCERIYKFPMEKEINIPDHVKIKNISEILNFIT